MFIRVVNYASGPTYFNIAYVRYRGGSEAPACSDGEWAGGAGRWWWRAGLDGGGGCVGRGARISPGSP